MNDSRQEILEALRAAYRAVVPNAERVPAWEDELLELGVASVPALEMAGILEERFEIRFPEHELAELRTVADFGNLIERLRNPPV